MCFITYKIDEIYQWILKYDRLEVIAIHFIFICITNIICYHIFYIYSKFLDLFHHSLFGCTRFIFQITAPVEG